MQFKDLSDLNSEIAFVVCDRIGSAAQFGHSNVSEAAYVNATVWTGECDDEIAADIKLRFACHGDYVSNADRTWRTDESARVIFSWDLSEPTEFDEDGEALEFDVTTVYGTDDERNDAGIPSGEADFDHVEIDDADFSRIVDEAVAFFNNRVLEPA